MPRPRRSKRRLQALRVHRPRVGIVQMALVGEQHDTEGEKREAEAGPGPDEGVGSRVLPTSDSKGQFSVQDQVVPGRRATVVRAA